MSATWIVIADSASARIFRPARAGRELNLLKEMEHPDSRMPGRGLTTDRPGRAFDSAGPGRHAMAQQTGPREHEAWTFCRRLADEIEAARGRNQFDRLVLVAAPAFLGRLRQTLGDPALKTLKASVDKDLTGLRTDQLLKQLPEEVLR